MAKHHIIIDAMRVTKGDRVILFLPADVEDDEAKEISETLKTHFPGVQFFALIGAEGYVYKPTPTNKDRTYVEREYIADDDE